MSKYQLLTATSMGVRITPADHQPAGIGNLYTMTSTSAESNVLNVAASLGMRTKVLTRWVKDSPIAMFIKGDLRRRNIEYEGPEIAPDGPWGCRHQFNIADTGYGMRGPRVYNDRAGEVGRVGRGAGLVEHDLKARTRSGQRQHRLDEVAAVFTVEPRSPDNHMADAAAKDRLLAMELREPVDAGGSALLAFATGSVVWVAAKYIVGANMNQ